MKGQKNRPQLKQAGDLTRRDFAAHPVWVHCHIVDYDEPWYDETDEETFRPWLGPLPVDSAQAIFLLSAEALFADGSKHRAIITPGSSEDDLGSMQPSVFLGRRWFPFWGGRPGIPQTMREDFYREARRARIGSIFPVRFSAVARMSNGVTETTVHGFYRMHEDQIVCEK